MENSKLLYKTIGISIAVISLIAMIALTIHENALNNQTTVSDSTANDTTGTLPIVADTTSQHSVPSPVSTFAIIQSASTTGIREEKGDSDSDDATGTDTDNNDESVVVGTTNTATGTATRSPAPTPAPTPLMPSSAPVPTNVYNDGTYSATGDYMSPGGLDSVSVTLTLKNDIIASTSTTTSTNSSTSRYYQSLFLSDYKTYVVGKPIASVYLTKVSGASLTPKGFDIALSKIRTQAKA